MSEIGKLLTRRGARSDSFRSPLPLPGVFISIPIRRTKNSPTFLNGNLRLCGEVAIVGCPAVSLIADSGVALPFIYCGESSKFMNGPNQGKACGRSVLQDLESRLTESHAWHPSPNGKIIVFLKIIVAW